MATNFFGDDFFSGAFFSNSAQSQKRLSAINFSCPWRGPNVAAQDASFTLGNRAGAVFMYASFAADAVATGTPKFMGLTRDVGRVGRF